MRKKYLRSSFSVEAEKYEPGKNMEDGFEPWTKVVTAGWIITERHCCGEDKFSTRFKPDESA